MGVLTIDTAALEQAAAAAGRAATGYEDVRAAANGRLGVGAGMSGWEADASLWGHSYDLEAAQLLRGLEGLAAAYGRLHCATQCAAALYRFAEQAAAGSAATFERPVPPHGERCLPLPASAVGGKVPLLPELGQLIADAAGVRWPSGDTTALRSVAGVWQDIGRATREHAAAAERAATGALSGLRGADVLLLHGAHGELTACASVLADGCDALGQRCNEYAGAVELAHQQLVEEATAFTRDVALTLGVSLALAPVSAGLSVWISGAAGAARLAAAASIFRSVVGALGAASARAAGTSAAAMARIATASHRMRGILASSTAFAAQGMARAATRAKTALASENMVAARALSRRHGDSLLGVLAAGPESLVLQLAGQTAQRRVTAQLAPQLLSPVPIANPVTAKPGRMVPFVFSVFTAYNWAQRADSAWTLTTKDSWLKQVLGTGGGNAVPPARDNRSPALRPGPALSPSPRPGPAPSSAPRTDRGPGPASGHQTTAKPAAPFQPSVGSTTRPSPPPAPTPQPHAVPPEPGRRDSVSRLRGAERPGPGSPGTCPIPKSSPDHQKDGSAGSR